MKKLIILGAILSIVLMLGACNSEKTQKESADTDVFTESDVQMANEMVQLLEEKSSEFQTKATDAIATGEIEQDKDGQLSEPLQELAKETVLKPFLEQYPNGIIGEEGDLTVSFEATASEACPLGNCKYDGVAIPEIDFDKTDYSTYTSEVFGVSQLIFQNVKSKFNVKDQELEKSELRFVKSKNGDLVMTSNPFISGEAFYLDELDKEFKEIKSGVPESEVEAEEDEFKQEVEELLSNYPKLR